MSLTDLRRITRAVPGRVRRTWLAVLLLVAVLSGITITQAIASQPAMPSPATITAVSVNDTPAEAGVAGGAPVIASSCNDACWDAFVGCALALLGCTLLLALAAAVLLAHDPAFLSWLLNRASATIRHAAPLRGTERPDLTLLSISRT